MLATYWVDSLGYRPPLRGVKRIGTTTPSPEEAEIIEMGPCGVCEVSWRPPLETQKLPVLSPSMPFLSSAICLGIQVFRVGPLRPPKPPVSRKPPAFLVSLVKPGVVKGVWLYVGVALWDNKLSGWQNQQMCSQQVEDSEELMGMILNRQLGGW